MRQARVNYWCSQHKNTRRACHDLSRNLLPTSFGHGLVGNSGPEGLDGFLAGGSGWRRRFIAPVIGIPRTQYDCVTADIPISGFVGRPLSGAGVVVLCHCTALHGKGCPTRSVCAAHQTLFQAIAWSLSLVTTKRNKISTLRGNTNAARAPPIHDISREMSGTGQKSALEMLGYLNKTNCEWCAFCPKNDRVRLARPIPWKMAPKLTGNIFFFFNT